MNFYDVLAAEKWGCGIPTTNFFDLLFAQSISGEQWQVYEGTLPATFNANGDNMKQYQIYGNIGGVGDVTENKLDKHLITNNYPGELWGDIPLSVKHSTPYTLKTNCPRYSGGTLIALDNKTSGTTTPNNGAWNGQTRTITSTSEGVLYVRYRGNNSGYDLTSYSYMLTEGTTPPENYVPYGYEVDISTSDGTSATVTPIYIGNEPLGKGEYIDYQAGKVYRKKAVHEDTVTINGIVWDILGYDCDTAYKDDNTLAQHTVTIQTHNCINELQFDAREALFTFPEGLAAGAYHFTINAQPWCAGDVNKTITFIITSAIPAGGQLVVNNSYNATMIGSTISLYASGSATIAIETVTMSEGSGGTDLGSVDVSLSQDGNTNSIQRALLGSNNWSQSAIRQYLNSAATAGSVWTPQTKFDRPPSWVANTAGFLRNADPEFISVLGNTTKITALNAATDGGGSETTSEKVFLLSRSEVYGGNEVSGGEGAPYPYYANYSSLSTAGSGNDSNRSKYRNGTAIIWWLRSPNVENANHPRSVHTSGMINSYTMATQTYSISPACVIILDDIATNSWLQEKFLKPTDPPVALPALPTCNGKTIVDYAGSGTAPEKVYFEYQGGKQP